MILTILLFTLGVFIFLILAVAVLLPIAKVLYLYGSEKDDWYSTFDEDLVD
jgi:hypothetical protein